MIDKTLYEKICEHNDYCGGCTYQEESYINQLKIKEDFVTQCLTKRGIKPQKRDDIEPSPILYAYRNKMEYTFGDMVKDGEMTLGMHKKGFHMSIITVDKCQLVHSDYNKILLATLNFAKENKYSKYNKKTHKGLLRHLIIRSGYYTKEILINIVTSTQEDFDEVAFKDLIFSLDLEHKVVGILRTKNDNRADAVNNEGLSVIYGRDYYMDKIFDLDFKVSAFSFFQTNISAVENLYKSAIELVPNFKDKVVFDLFCGTGTISQAIANSCKEVIGIELVEDAVNMAIENTKLNNIKNCKFISGDVFKVIDEVKEKPDIIIVDPPRMGIEPKALDKILSYQVDYIVYISCNPKTMVDNLYYMEHFGYKVDYLKAFDNFPNTKHVETIALIQRVKS